MLLILCRPRAFLQENMQGFVERNAFTHYTILLPDRPNRLPLGISIDTGPGVQPCWSKPFGSEAARTFLTYIAFLIVFYFLAKRHIPELESLLAVGLFAFNPTLLLFLDNILSDIPFLFLSTLSLLVLDHYTQRGNVVVKTGFRPWLSAFSGLIIFFAFFVRTQGILILVSVLIFQGVRFLQHGNNK